MKRLGVRIRRKREDQQLKLNDLAQKVGVSSSALSQIENAKAFPSILTLKNIANSLHTTVGELIGENETLFKQPLIRNEEKKFVRENKSGAKLYLLSHHDPLKQMETYLVEFEQDANSENIMNSHPGQEFCYVIEGKLEFILEDKTYILEAQDSFYFNSNAPHLINNMSLQKSKIIWVVTPPNI